MFTSTFVWTLCEIWLHSGPVSPPLNKKPLISINRKNSFLKKAICSSDAGMEKIIGGETRSGHLPLPHHIIRAQQ